MRKFLIPTAKIACLITCVSLGLWGAGTILIRLTSDIYAWGEVSLLGLSILASVPVMCVLMAWRLSNMRA
jgi:hypothetical protein